ncbi:hypothetical protein BC826DRAFT_158431 [Russula brevipes]|nr:hypothetical protein BC826DRAFT_158431 [Russula brevipes]
MIRPYTVFNCHSTGGNGRRRPFGVRTTGRQRSTRQHACQQLLTSSPLPCLPAHYLLTHAHAHGPRPTTSPSPFDTGLVILTPAQTRTLTTTAVCGVFCCHTMTQRGRKASPNPRLPTRSNAMACRMQNRSSFNSQPNFSPRSNPDPPN